MTNLKQLALIFLSNIGRARDGFVDSIGDLLTVPWIDNDAAVETLRSTSKFTENHHALPFLLAGYVFV